MSFRFNLAQFCLISLLLINRYCLSQKITAGINSNGQTWTIEEEEEEDIEPKRPNQIKTNQNPNLNEKEDTPVYYYYYYYQYEVSDDENEEEYNNYGYQKGNDQISIEEYENMFRFDDDLDAKTIEDSLGEDFRGNLEGVVKDTIRESFHDYKVRHNMPLGDEKNFDGKARIMEEDFVDTLQEKMRLALKDSGYFKLGKGKPEPNKKAEPDVSSSDGGLELPDHLQKLLFEKAFENFGVDAARLMAYGDDPDEHPFNIANFDYSSYVSSVAPAVLTEFMPMIFQGFGIEDIDPSLAQKISDLMTSQIESKTNPGKKTPEDSMEKIRDVFTTLIGHVAKSHIKSPKVVPEKSAEGTTEQFAEFLKPDNIQHIIELAKNQKNFGEGLSTFVEELVSDKGKFKGMLNEDNKSTLEAFAPLIKGLASRENIPDGGDLFKSTDLYKELEQVMTSQLGSMVTPEMVSKLMSGLKVPSKQSTEK